jgi:hypothetical protein
MPPESRGVCFICGGSLDGVTARALPVLGGALIVDACGPCVDLPDTPEFVASLITERLGPRVPNA